MTFNEALMHLVILVENPMMPKVFRPTLDKVIRTLSEIQPDSEWIVCSDGLPDTSDYDEEFLLSIRAVYNDHEYSEWDVYMGIWTPHGWDVPNYWWNTYEVMAWKRKPEPYQPKEDKK